MKWFKSIICLFKGHRWATKESFTFKLDECERCKKHVILGLAKGYGFKNINKED